MIICIGLSAILTFLGVDIYYKMAYPIKFYDEIKTYSEQYKVDKSLILAVIYAESRFQPNAVSNIGARGLMQITDETFEWAKWRMGDEVTVYDDLFIPQTNIKYGTFIISLLKDEFTSDHNALAAYHAGWGSVKKWLANKDYSSDGIIIDKIPFKDTAWYVPKVLEVRKRYIKIYNL